MGRVYQTRMVGYAPDQRHLLAPPEVVYLVDAPPLRVHWLTWRWVRAVGLLVLDVCLLSLVALWPS